MTCLNPITAWKKRYASLTQDSYSYYRDKKLKFKDPKNKDWEKIKIACNNCLGCRLDHANMWSTRIMIESKRHKDNCFVTLTYKPEKLPLTDDSKMTLKKKDFQDFIKRLRFHTKQKLLYFACGEYGTTTFRPHYHCIIFGWKPNDLKEIMASKTGNTMYTSPTLEKIWGNGFITIEELNYKTACYTARYVQKKAGIKPQHRIQKNWDGELEEKTDERNGKTFVVPKNKYKTEEKDMFGRQKEFLLMSKKPAIGLTYWQKNKESIKKNNGILLKIDDTVKNKPIPRYFKKQWEKEDMLEFDIAKYKEKIKIDNKIKEQLKNINDPNPEKKWLEYLKSGLENRAKYLKRNEV